MKIPAKQRDFQLAPVGRYKGVLCDVIDLGEYDNSYKPGEKVAYMTFAFQTEHRMNNGKPYVVRSPRFTQKFPGRTNLSRYVISLRGRKFTKEEEDDFEFDDLIGTNALITVEHHLDASGKMWAKAVKAEPLPEGEEATLKVENYLRVQEYERNSAPAE